MHARLSAPEGIPPSVAATNACPGRGYPFCRSHGSGKLDTARDCVGLAALYRKHAAKTRGKTAVTAAEIAETAALGDELLKLLKPTRAKKTRPEDVKKAAEVRDRRWTLVKLTYDELWRACAYIYGADEVAARVPALQAHTATTSKRKTANAAKRNG